MAAGLVIAEALVHSKIVVCQPGKLEHQLALRDGTFVAACAHAVARLFYCVTGAGTFPRALPRHHGADIAARLLQPGVVDCFKSD